ncbi:uncharacterized protein LOC115320100 isoform X2 [Ixodes scapularis]|uniref:uncharacterized protein LOC115320100 isoform X2 n=1 Tax=Ixodes scapularis TaxID=6945 RepID=UPI001A9D9BF9|nr:uncharacterized protein LOC115320100 isoform X2 [Ixodes scapularis]
MEATVSSPVSPPVDSQVPMKLVQEMSTSDKFPLDLSEARSALSAPNNLVPLEHVQKLESINSQHDLKLAPHIKEKHLNSLYFDKMDVGSAYTFLNHAVGAAIKYLVQEGIIGEETLTRAWFLELVFKWFSLMTSRTIKLAVSELNPKKHEEAVTLLEKVGYIFSRLSFYKARIEGVLQTVSGWHDSHSEVCPQASTALNLRKGMKVYFHDSYDTGRSGKSLQLNSQKKKKRKETVSSPGLQNLPSTNNIQPVRCSMQVWKL